MLFPFNQYFKNAVTFLEKRKLFYIYNNFIKTYQTNRFSKKRNMRVLKFKKRLRHSFFLNLYLPKYLLNELVIKTKLLKKQTKELDKLKRAKIYHKKIEKERKQRLLAKLKLLKQNKTKKKKLTKLNTKIKLNTEVKLNTEIKENTEVKLNTENKENTKNKKTLLY